MVSLACATLGFTAGHSQAQEEIRQPFGLTWGLEPKAFLTMTKGTPVKVVDKKTEGGREIWTVEGFIQPNLKRALLYFARPGTLQEVELQYEQPAWDFAQFSQYMAQIRARIEGRYGQGILLTRKREPNGKTITFLEGYQWTQAFTTLQLFFFSATQGDQKFHSISLHYKETNR